MFNTIFCQNRKLEHINELSRLSKKIIQKIQAFNSTDCNLDCDDEEENGIANRELVQQIGFNPFLGESSYADDIAIRDQYLKPQNTTQGLMRTKET